MNLHPKEKYKLEYAEVGRLRQHYSTIRSSLTTFAMTSSLAAFAKFLSEAPRPLYLALIGWFMFVVAFIACFVFSYRTEKANLYAEILWRWFKSEKQSEPPSFLQYKEKRCDVVCQMLRDEMNWFMLVALLLIVVAAFYF
ncbi:MAG: hypothetical protein PHD76_03310 [Methylacidiphilales bacterium]|nr:hypothetical protein [Candidatus Methylacidiphilales bacterium]